MIDSLGQPAHLSHIKANPLGQITARSINQELGSSIVVVAVVVVVVGGDERSARLLSAPGQPVRPALLAHRSTGRALHTFKARYIQPEEASGATQSTQMSGAK